ncbi:alpha-amylase/4-alpha-glucanotransferase domain-containing protein [Verrucomicrobium sp. GAS474]|uniref:alpha-amylase/4-alpha-glucanotransferase domain-containing protein n=1 Tax=Verrucomicrobium sp. GAS474 TaxID=1882831 RepID=UPI00138FCBD6|nr:alpha-amylase/4-alpha-glucanotransferase domain-containing protein [Verrucomicrobium sp. GAS474]
MKKVTLAWAVHFHQPPGNFREVLETYASRTCTPFLAMLARHPQIRLSLHFSGVLLKYLKEHRPDLIATLGELVRRNQVELLGGGFYEPIWSLIPPADAVAQLRKMSDWVQDEFACIPKGAWLPESVWEPRFVEILHQAGYEYALLEDTLFEAVGWKRAQLFRGFSVPHLNNRTVLFPYHRIWSRQIPTEGVREIKAAFNQLSNRPDEQIVTLAQSGDLYAAESIHSGGHGHAAPRHLPVYGSEGTIGAFEEWLLYLESERHWIEMAHFGEVARRRWPVAAPASGAAEGLEACVLNTVARREYDAARAELQKRFDGDRFVNYFRGGNWAGFLGKYAEARLMLHRLLWLRGEVDKLPPGQVKARATALEALLCAEEHTTFWHARTGGVYANYLRDAVYQRLLEAEKALHSQDRKETPKENQVDYDGDGHDEVLLRSRDASALVIPQYGGSLCEYAFLPTAYNLANTFRRRVEVYHDTTRIETQIEDWYERRLFQDHFVPTNTAPSAFKNNTFVEHGDFVNQPYEIVQTENDRNASMVVLERQGGLYFGRERRALTCRKVFKMENPGRLTVDYTLTNKGDLPTDLFFVSEVNYTCLSGDSPERLIQVGNQPFICGADFAIPKPEGWTISDTSRKLLWKWTVTPGADLWHHPIHTARSPLPHAPGEGLPRTEWDYQGSAFQIVWPLRLKQKEEASFRIVCEFLPVP